MSERNRSCFIERRGRFDGGEHAVRLRLQEEDLEQAARVQVEGDLPDGGLLGTVAPEQLVAARAGPSALPERSQPPCLGSGIEATALHGRPL
jgi:hypothetical protein